MVKIVNLESLNYSHRASTILRGIGELSLYDALTKKEALFAIKDAEILISRLRFKLDEELLKDAKNLKIVATPTTGTDHVDTEYLKKRGIKFISLKGETKFLKKILATAEHTITLTLSLLRHIPKAVEHTKTTTKWDRDLFKGSELFEKTVGIIGFGRLGSRVAQIFNAFGCEVLATDIKEKEFPEFVKNTDLKTLLNKSDIVSLHIDLNENNVNFFNQELIDEMKKGAYFINTSRGACVDENALAKALKEKKLGGIAVDVLANEVDKTIEDSPLFQLQKEGKNIIITPHIGGATKESMEKTEIFIAERIFFKYRELKDESNIN